MKRLPALLLAPLLLLAAYLAWSRACRSAAAGPRQTEEPAGLFAEAVALVESDYVDAVDPEVSGDRACSALLQELDPLSAYLSRAQERLLPLLASGSLCSAGLFGRMEAGKLQITSIRPDSAAALAGLGRGDRIKTVNGLEIGGGHWQILLRFAGAENESLAIALDSGEAAGTEKRIRLRREAGGAVSELEPGLYWLRLGRLQRAAVDEIESLLSGRESCRLVADLRFCEWGDLESLLRLSRLLFRADCRLVLRSRSGRSPLATGDPGAAACRAVAVVDESTAMHGELLAAMFRSQGLALVGRRTAGAAAHIEHFALADGSGMLLPTGRFELQGREVGRSPLVPDVEIAEEKVADAVAVAARLVRAKG